MSKSVRRFGQVLWPPVTDDGRVPTKPFLEACDVIVHFFDALGTLFSPVKHDVQGNVNKLISKHATHPEKFVTLNDIIEAELGTQDCSATESLLWLKRGLHFTCLLLLSIIEDHEKKVTYDSLAPNYQYAYEISLKSHHNWVVQKFFTVCVRSRICPKRRDVMKSLARDESSEESEVVATMKEFVNGLITNLQAIFDLYVANGLDNCKQIR